ncbi:MAG TPA: hypothetical protein VL961_03090 [Acidimicrobiales bacterium]|nr:hypothetical protein [Acidimicrobiales bacterium]
MSEGEPEDPGGAAGADGAPTDMEGVVAGNGVDPARPEPPGRPRRRRARREVEKFEFAPPSDERVCQALEVVVAAGDGWINLLPGVNIDEEEASARPSPFAIFSNRQPPVTMCTLVPPRAARRTVEGVTVGIMHPTGRKAAERLADGGVPVPRGWRVTQDHARRGVVVKAPPGAADAEVVAWAIAAGTCLCRVEMTGQWQAVVYLP